MTPGGKPEELGQSKGEGYIFNIYIIYSKRFYVDRLNPLGRVYYTKLRNSLKCCVTPGGKPEELSQSQGEGYIFNIYIKYSKRFYIDRLSPLGRDYCTKLRKISKNAVWGHIL